MMCRVLGVSTSGFYAWRDRPPSARGRQDAVILEKIVFIHERSRGTYGAPRIHFELDEDFGIHCGKKRVARLMRQNGFCGVHRRKKVRTTRRDDAHDKAVDLIKREFDATEIDRLWLADITYIPTWAGFLYLAVVLDACSRKVVGWAMADHLRTELVLEALNMAIYPRRRTRRRPPRSDPGRRSAPGVGGGPVGVRRARRVSSLPEPPPTLRGFPSSAPPRKAGAGVPAGEGDVVVLLRRVRPLRPQPTPWHLLPRHRPHRRRPRSDPGRTGQHLPRSGGRLALPPPSGYTSVTEVATSEAVSMEVGIRALRERLSEWVDRVRAGEELVVTDRGKAVARLVPIGHERALDRLIREGLVEPAPLGERRRPSRRVQADGGVSDLIARR